MEYPPKQYPPQPMSKVTVVGAGNVGATVANVLAHEDLVREVVVLDIKGDMARGKALDSWQQASIDNYSTRLTGTENYAETADSDIVVITAGIPRKPGMSRDDLISTNAKIVTMVTKSIMEYSKNPIIIVVSNPLDVMTHAAFVASGLPRNRVFGMAGILDTARYRAFLATALDVSPKDIQGHAPRRPRRYHGAPTALHYRQRHPRHRNDRRGRTHRHRRPHQGWGRRTRQAHGYLGLVRSRCRRRPDGRYHPARRKPHLPLLRPAPGRVRS